MKFNNRFFRDSLLCNQAKLQYKFVYQYMNTSNECKSAKGMSLILAQALHFLGVSRQTSVLSTIVHTRGVHTSTVQYLVVHHTFPS